VPLRRIRRHGPGSWRPADHLRRPLPTRRVAASRCRPSDRHVQLRALEGMARAVERPAVPGAGNSSPTTVPSVRSQSRCGAWVRSRYTFRASPDANSRPPTSIARIVPGVSAEAGSCSAGEPSRRTARSSSGAPRDRLTEHEAQQRRVRTLSAVVRSEPRGRAAAPLRLRRRAVLPDPCPRPRCAVSFR
jgi:hypothetical protein